MKRVRVFRQRYFLVFCNASSICSIIHFVQATTTNPFPNSQQNGLDIYRHGSNGFRGSYGGRRGRGRLEWEIAEEGEGRRELYAKWISVTASSVILESCPFVCTLLNLFSFYTKPLPLRP